MGKFQFTADESVYVMYLTLNVRDCTKTQDRPD
jgi:hypothetical protein